MKKMLFASWTPINNEKSRSRSRRRRKVDRDRDERKRKEMWCGPGANNVFTSQEAKKQKQTHRNIESLAVSVYWIWKIQKTY